MQYRQLLFSCKKYSDTTKLFREKLSNPRRSIYLSNSNVEDDGRTSSQIEGQQDMPDEHQQVILQQLEQSNILHDFKNMELNELRRNVRSRKKHMYKMIEEMRRLRIQKELQEQQSLHERIGRQRLFSMWLMPGQRSRPKMQCMLRNWQGNVLSLLIYWEANDRRKTAQRSV
eukprot:TRINITY_DN7903_c0_g2_i2.p3 TRINITY_DN7903_c0_g2~~TRINITY_DN7903_c0_g2_i2.p3  ORF type:complete len:172 (-),score=9.11 TRINITY_DN7903_c0_g2_i2:292-807(-)